jgi:hypothetical protein
MKAKIIVVSIILLLGAGTSSFAQKASISTNIIEWANVGTANINAGVSIAQHLSLNVGGRYNNWSPQKQTTVYSGVRYWPWYVFSGWWFGTDLQYSSYNKLRSKDKHQIEGQSLGAGFSFGYTLMLHQNLNIEFGGGISGSYNLQYSEFESAQSFDPLPVRKRFDTIDSVSDLLNELSVSIMYVF